MGTKTTLKAGVLSAYKELQQAREFLSNLANTFKECLSEKNACLTEKIGSYARNMPEFHFLSSKAEDIKSGIRLVCSGEITLEEGLEGINSCLDELDVAMSCFSIEAISADNKVCAGECNCGNHCDCNHKGGTCYCEELSSDEETSDNATSVESSPLVVKITIETNTTTLFEKLFN